MSKKPSVPPSWPSSLEKSEKKPHPPSESASKKADKDIRKGNPLPANNLKERSPKQENL